MRMRVMVVLEVGFLIVDFVVFAHLVFVALGLGLALRLDLIFFQTHKERFDPRLLEDAAHSHKYIALALLGLWCSGLGLIYVRTGFALDQFSPKLWVKLIVVSMLSVNALVIAAFVLPTLHKFQDRPVLQIPKVLLVPMAMSAATSMMCWFAALALGAMTVLKTQPWSLFLQLFGGAFCAGILVAICAAVFAGAGARDDLQIHEDTTC